VEERKKRREREIGRDRESEREREWGGERWRNRQTDSQTDRQTNREMFDNGDNLWSLPLPHSQNQIIYLSTLLRMVNICAG